MMAMQRHIRVFGYLRGRGLDPKRTSALSWPEGAIPFGFARKMAGLAGCSEDGDEAQKLHIRLDDIRTDLIATEDHIGPVEEKWSRSKSRSLKRQRVKIETAGRTPDPELEKTIMAQELRNALPAGYRLEEYEIESMLGHGGFGVTYLARDARVAIKEFMPVDLAVREDGISVHPRSESDREEFLWGLDRFLTEAPTLAADEIRLLHHMVRPRYVHIEDSLGEHLSVLRRLLAGRNLAPIRRLLRNELLLRTVLNLRGGHPRRAFKTLCFLLLCL